MKFLIDMNLSPDWLDAFTAEGWEAYIGRLSASIAPPTKSL